MRPVLCEHCKKQLVDGDEIWWAGQVMFHLTCAEDIGLAKRPTPEEVWGRPMHKDGTPCKELVGLICWFCRKPAVGAGKMPSQNSALPACNDHKELLVQFQEQAGEARECGATGDCIHKFARYATYTYFQEPELPYRYPAAFD